MIAFLAFIRRIPGEVWLILIAVMMVASLMWWAYGEGKAAGDEVRRDQQFQIHELTAANTAAQDVIEQLQKVNRELAEGRAADRQAAERAVATLRTERDRLRQEVETRRRQRGFIYENDPNAGAWASARVPDAVADGLR